MIAEKVIKNYLDNNGVKIIFLAKNTGIHNSNLSKSLSGKRNLKADELISICQTLKLELSDFNKVKII